MRARVAEAVMGELYRATMYVFYSQIGLFDVQDWAEYPYESGVRERLGIVGQKWVVVLAESDSEVEVVVTEGEGGPGGRRVLAGELSVGNQGIQVGSPPSDLVQIAWPPGRTRVSVYGQGPEARPSQIFFLLQHLGRSS